MSQQPGMIDPDRLDASLQAAIDALFSLQKPDGHWCAELQGDSILASEYLLMKFILGQENAPMRDGRTAAEVLPRIANWMRSMQRADGTWGQYPGASMDVSATVKAYFALKLLGDDPDAPHMTAAREAVRKAGGAELCNSFTNFYLACLGQISWNAVPSIPPEVIWLPRWFLFHMDKVSAWTRTMILPLALVSALKPTRRLPRRLGIDELFISQRDRHRLTFLHRPEIEEQGFFSAATLFRMADKTIKWAERLGLTPLRRMAMRDALAWILERSGATTGAATDGLGAIFPPMVYIQIALNALGYPRHDPIVRHAERELDAFFIEAGEHIRIQPCFSPVWDTGIALYALCDAGLDASDPRIEQAAAWLRSNQCEHVGDWVRNLKPQDQARYLVGSACPRFPRESWTPGVEAGWTASAHALVTPPPRPRPPAGWCFEYHNAWYPDVDDTAMVAMALRRAGGAANHESARRGVEWILDMQNDDGGWAAFDRTVDRPILELIPFADHNAMQDPSCPDITGRVLECLAWHGYTKDHPAVAKAIRYIRSRQEPDGCWFGRWGVNYIYGTWQAVIGPIRTGVHRDEPWVQRAGKWIKSIQQPDGSFGESADTYEMPIARGQGIPTASQTAWASMVLFEIFGPHDPDLSRAIQWLMKTQMTPEQAANRAWNVDGDRAGSWRELEYTGTGFPRVFYLRYHLYRLYFPLMALARYRRSVKPLPGGLPHLARMRVPVPAAG
ncbi:MAG: squalene--hopene cyclase [Phycisphaeraceae bacterium]|nr:MAG: squalene--hopene cyclase [Phycisphaeraceae bacterium]